MVHTRKLSVNSLEFVPLATDLANLENCQLFLLWMFLRHLAESGKDMIFFVAGILL